MYIRTSYANLINAALCATFFYYAICSKKQAVYITSVKTYASFYFPPKFTLN